MVRKPFDIVLADDLDTIARFDGHVLKIQSFISSLAPPLDEPGIEEEVKAYQVFTCDLIRFGAACYEGKSAVEAVSFGPVYQHYRTRPHDLEILLDICTQGKYGVVDVAKFKYFHVAEIDMGEEYIAVLREVKARLDREAQESPEFPW